MRSLSVNGRSAEVMNSTRSARGTKSVVMRSCWRMMALARQGVDLQDVRLVVGVAVQAEVDPRHIAAAQHAEGRGRVPVQVDAQLLVQRRRAEVVEVVGQLGLDPAGVDAPLLGRVAREVHLQRRQEVQAGRDARGILVARHASRHGPAQVAHHAHSDLAAVDEMLHQRRLAVAGEDLLDLAAQLGFIVHYRTSADAHARALAGGLDEHGEGQVVVQRLVHPLEGLKGGRGQAVEVQDALGHRLVQRQRQRHDPRTGVGDAHHLQQRRHLRLAAVAPVALGNVEADVGPVIRWLLDSDPAIRWQVLRDLTGAPARRSRPSAPGRQRGLGRAAARPAGGRRDVGRRGVEPRLGLHHARPVLLRDLGLDPASEEAQRAVGLVRERVTWQGCGPAGCDDNPFFAGEVEPCINGQVGRRAPTSARTSAASSTACSASSCPTAAGTARPPMARRGPRSTPRSACWRPCSSTSAPAGRSPEVTEARLRGQEYLLERRLFRRRSTGEVIERDRKGGAAWTRFAFPTWWHYDVLRGLEYLRRAGAAPDERVAEAIELVESKRGARRPLAARDPLPGVMPVEIDEGEGQPSRWITLRALRIHCCFYITNIRSG
jgi:hypothetical protein